jgi:hypothetical protein
MARSGWRVGAAPILVKGGARAATPAAVGEAACRFAMGNTEPGPAETQAAVGGFSGVHVATGRFSRLWRRRCSKL